MYYISRRIGTSKYGVVDTDDGVENVLTVNELREAVIDLGLEIKGVETYVKIGRTKNTKRLWRISVYQPENDIKANQVKLNILNGIDIKTNGTEIVSFGWRSMPRNAMIPVRLSNFGTSCADCIFSEIREHDCQGISLLVIVLDDKIEVTTKTFKGCGYLGIHIDLREVTNSKTAECVYKEIMSQSYMTPTILSQRVDDVPNRLDFWKAVCVLNRGISPLEHKTHIAQVVANPYKIQEEIDKHYVNEFLSISDCKFQVNRHGETSAILPQYVLWLMEDYNLDIRVSEDYDLLKVKCMQNLFRVLKWETTCNAGVVTRFENYIQYFIVPTGVRTAFVKFCRSANEYLIDYGRKSGWLH